MTAVRRRPVYHHSTETRIALNLKKKLETARIHVSYDRKVVEFKTSSVIKL